MAKPAEVGGSPAPPSSDRWIGPVVVAFVALHLIWFPRIFAIIDESTYLSTAYVYRAGTIYHDVAGIDSVTRVETDGHRVSKFGPLMPFLLVPFTWLGWRQTLAANLLLHLIGFLLFRRLVRDERLPAWTSLLYLFHPTLVFYSRTLMSDVASGVFFLAALVLVRRPGARSVAAAGFWAGMSCLVRETNGVLIALLLTALLVDRARGRGASGPLPRIGFLLVGLALPAVALIVYHEAAFGVWWRGTAGYHGEHGLGHEFGAGLFPGGLLHYGVSLLTVYPGMLIAFLLDRRRSWRAWIPAVGFTLFFCFYYYRDRGPSFPATAVVGLRFLIPVLPFFLLPYARLLTRASQRRTFAARGVAPALVVAGLAASALIHVRHDAHLRAQETNRDALYETTPAGSTILGGVRARELVHDVWGPRHFLRWEWTDGWRLPEDAGGDTLYVALVGGNRRDDPEGVPAPLQEVLDRSGARLLRMTDVHPPLRIWRVEPGAYRATP